MSRLGKAIGSFVAMALSGVAMWTATRTVFEPEVLLVVLTTGMLSYLFSAAVSHEVFEDDGVVHEIIGLYHGAYTLLAAYLFVLVAYLVHPSLAVILAAPFAYFFPASHVKCELHPDHCEEHTVSAATLLIVTLYTAVAIGLL